MRKLTTEEFITKARKVHGELYSYGNFKYVNCMTKSFITCKIHGDFKQKPNDHLGGHGCPYCKGNDCAKRRSLDTSEFIEKAKSTHGDKYDYSLVQYNGCYEKVRIICPKHGVFEQKASAHLIGYGCQACGYMVSGISKQEKEVVEFIRSFYPNEIIENDRIIISPKELDIVFPDLKLAIEYNGNYWHEQKSDDYHINKIRLAHEAGYYLIFVWENDWLNRNEETKQRLRNIIR